ncbi:hypothetical protein GLOIN_2v1498039 [Rhizophagus irregularis DAOM 181602=DAOM 197198]|uniref:Uncharacterized protein n=1 Tax=Rhizophagus irregularis (strain DAOM 181602 / DAOM 197198 / MUCL 43194) TaxID=747089 RepID=A0A2P4QXT1_RHIID|nr:hypothetical protein GLOIN_2v1498039 [Rhizophagus irregularis DAOM 181602=DAOM 197198]POG82378.1 hypothetical protein GLOIN_2v1498039 [Rhizophagus irregularis DAOM 181602=DAOM 197198]|eukprot:XP_025189244.1 hypothetical protein GLOIN_2v1498039 [Rhizophagus irregularis DAOM 181602=DAOM 197198]
MCISLIRYENIILISTLFYIYYVYLNFVQLQRFNNNMLMTIFIFCGVHTYNKHFSPFIFF